MTWHGVTRVGTTVSSLLQASMKRLFSAGTVRVDGEVLELDAGGFVLLHGEDLHCLDLFSQGSELASTDHFFVQVKPRWKRNRSVTARGAR